MRREIKYLWKDTTTDTSITQTWMVEIKYIRGHRSLADKQRIGLFESWYHYHELAEIILK